MNSKKLVSAALTATTVLWMVGATVLPVASAQTTASLQSQIMAFQSEIAQLQAELNGSGTMTTSSYAYTRDLTVGSTGADVSALQQFLINGKYLTAVSAPTGYFGALTQTALGKFQAAVGISPTAGYFGPKTRSYLATLGVTTTIGTGSSTVTVATGAPLSIALDSQTPGSSNVAAGAVNTPVLKLDFTAGATPVTVTNLILTRTGLSQDSDLNNVYLYNGATKLASNLGFNNGQITFSNGAGLFTVPANSTMVIAVSVDVASSSNSGHIFQVGLASAANVTGGTFTGNFPLNSGQFTIASVSNLATLTITNVQNGSTTVNAGQLNDLVGQMTVTAGNNPIKVTAVNLTNIGSVTPSYLQNVKLMNGSTQLGATISSLGSNNVATFDLSGAPLMLTSGQSAVLSLYADITGGVNRNFQFSVQQKSDIQAIDTTYGVGIGATTTVAGGFPLYFSQVSINNGGVVASRDASSPTTNVVAGNTNQMLAKIDVLASGDSIKFNEMDFKVTGNANLVINNLRVIDDQGAQIGTTVNATIPAGTSTVTTAEGSGSLNYIIPANTTRVLTVYGDIPSSASGTVQVQFGAGNTSAQSYTTYATAAVSPVSGNSLTILNSNTNLIVSENYGLGTPVSASAGAQMVKIGSYTLTAGQVNPVNLTGVTILATSSLGTNNWLTNLEVMNGSTQLGQTYATVTGGNTYSFNANQPIAIAANGSVTLDVYANISSNATASTTTNGVTALYSVNASTQSGNAITVSSTAGQNLSFNTGGALTGSLSAGTSQASYLGMNVPGVNVAQYQFVADNNGGETLTQVKILDSNTTANTSTIGTHASDLINYRLTDTSGNVLGTASEQSGVLTFNLAGLPISVNGTVYVNLVADTNAYPYAISGGTHAFDLQSFQYTNATQSQTATPSLANGMANLFTVYQTTLGVTGTSGWSTPNSISGVGNIVGEFTFAAGSGNINPKVEKIDLKVNGSLIGTSTAQTLALYDASAPSVILATGTMSTTASTTFNIASTTANQWVIPFSSSKTLLVKVLAGPTALVTMSGGSTGSYQVLLTGVTWADGTPGSTDITDPISSLSPSISLPVPSTNITGLTN